MRFPPHFKRDELNQPVSNYNESMARQQPQQQYRTQ